MASVKTQQKRSRSQSAPSKTRRLPKAASRRAPMAPAERIYAALRAIPRGKVATYGQLALLADIHAGHRVAARAMQVCPSGLPWHRVLGKKDARRAKIAIADAEHQALQRSLLEAEGVCFDASGCVPLRQFGWLPSEVAPKKGKRRALNTPRKQKNR